MSHLRIPLAAGLILFGLASAAAQTANSASPSSNTPGGPNQAQQFPSGGATANGAAAGKSQIGAPTAVEQEEQKRSEKDTQICKGC